MPNPPLTVQQIWDRLAQIPDPEVPVISITELGVVRGIEWQGSTLKITITPTYTGCPAMNLFSAEILASMHAQGIENVQLETVFSPAWTTDWIAPEAKIRLKEYGIAPPVQQAADADPFGTPPVVPCPRCDSEHTALKSQFGSTACKALYVCQSCHEPFEYFKHF